MLGVQEKEGGDKVMVLCSNHSSKAFHAFARLHPGKVGWIFGPSSFKKPRKDLPFALDNDAFGSWKNGTQWSESKWRGFLERVAGTGLKPIWVLVPDKVADREATLDLWHKFCPVVRQYRWPLAFAVQDGMIPNDVPAGAQVVFVGGTTSWKWRSIPTWTSHFARVHVGRVTTRERLEIAERCGAESVDGTGFFRATFYGKQGRSLVAFVEGHRNQNLEFENLLQPKEKP